MEPYDRYLMVKTHLYPTTSAFKGGSTNSHVLRDCKTFISSSIALFYWDPVGPSGGEVE